MLELNMLSAAFANFGFFPALTSSFAPIKIGQGSRHCVAFVDLMKSENIPLAKLML